MKRIAFFVFFVAVILLLFTESSLAAISPADLGTIQRQQDQIIHQQEERLRRQEREMLMRRGAPPALTEPDKLPHVESREKACMDVRKVVVSGVNLITDSELSGVVSRYEGQCLTLADMNNLLRDISNLYIEKGYVTSRAFLSPDQADDGLLQVVVVEGHVEKIIINDGDRNYYYRGRMAFPGLEGGPLLLWDIEQGLDQLNRLPSANAVMELEPGETLGGTVVKVFYPEKRTWGLGFGMDNFGQRATGQTQYNVSFVKDNFMGLGDQWALYWTEDLRLSNRELFRGREKTGHNQSFSGYVSIPYGYWTFSANASRFKYETTIFGSYQDYLNEGDTLTHSYQVERVIHRDGVSKTSLAASLNLRDNDTYIDGYRLDGSSYNLTTVRGSLSHNRKMFGGVAGMNFAYTRGVNWFGAEKREDSPMSPHSAFDKYSLYLSWYRPFETVGERFSWMSSFYGQWSPQTLYGAERIQIGSRYTVRGFHDSSMSGDKGGYLRNELSWNAPWPESVKSESFLYGFQVYGAYDYGFLVKDRRDPFERGEMHGVALGLRSIGSLSLDFCVSIPLKYPGYVKTRDTEYYITTSYNF